MTASHSLRLGRYLLAIVLKLGHEVEKDSVLAKELRTVTFAL